MLRYTDGIDISKWQGDVDWDKIPKNIEFVIMRATYNIQADKKFNSSVVSDNGLTLISLPSNLNVLAPFSPANGITTLSK